MKLAAGLEFIRTMDDGGGEERPESGYFFPGAMLSPVGFGAFMGRLPVRRACRKPLKPMNKLPAILLSSVLAGSAFAPAAGLMLDFGATGVASPYETLSPGHDAGAFSGSETTWNTIDSSAQRDDLFYSDGSAATGITLVMGQESTVGSNVVNFATPITNVALAGTGGGTAGFTGLLGTGSIYGDNTSSTAAGRDGFFGSGNGTSLTTSTAIGIRVDGLTAGDYRAYVMARNTNSNSGDRSMNIYTTTGSSAGTFDFGSLTPDLQQNPVYSSGTYAGEFTTFTAGQNFVAIDFTIGDGDSLFLSVDGATSTELRGFLNMAQIVAVPEPAGALLGMIGLLGLLRRRR